ncbi:hypothetical protein NE237_000087 [Protea cynaroides]|uniref:Uncharacterized protein n=1 Tax=Protea cynaroides TaxID=273540 RepID=A0A9Q0GK67_9MAGN|nr:hypothetical protein NE237_000087 [Protea cynaroides]
MLIPLDSSGKNECQRQHRRAYREVNGLLIAVEESSQIGRELRCNGHTLLYLKDWHFVKVHGLLFLLMFFRSYSWSANVCGKKKWFFLPPSQCHLVYDR